VKRYEGLFILNTNGKDEGIKETIDAISAEIVTAGGKVETVQKMDKRPFTRVADKKFTSGFYVNIIFESLPAAIVTLHSKLALKEDVFRALISTAPAAVPAAVPAK
jgi:small subunit ribosomal protein S6